MKKLTIILLVYNAELYIKKCIDSIVNQNFEDYNIIIINDCSNDNTLKIINDFLKLKKITLINNKRKMGIFYSRNIALKLCDSEYVTFINYYDFYEPKALSHNYEILNTNNLDILISNYYNFSDNEKKANIINNNYKNKYIQNKEEFIKYLLSNQDREFLFRLTIKTNYAKKIFFDEKKGIVNEIQWIICLLKNVNKIYCDDFFAYNYFIDEKRIKESFLNSKKNLENILLMNKFYVCYFNNNNQLQIAANIGLVDSIIKNLSRYIISGNINNNFLYDYRKKIDKIIMYIKPNYRIDIKIIYLLYKHECYNAMKNFIYIKEQLKKIIRNLKILKNKILLSYDLAASRIFYFMYKAKYKYNILNDEETVNMIINEKKSLSRLGDGEFKWLFNVKQYSFQEQSKELSLRLEEVILSNDSNIIIGIPKAIISMKNLNKNTRNKWKYFIFKHGKKIRKILDNNKKYADTNITRCYIDYIDKSDCKSKFDNLKRIWDKKDILIVEGCKTKLGVGNDLFDNVKSIKRILCPPINAFFKYDYILNTIIEKNKDNRLILLSLGPTATILAYDLAKKGFQAIDIGHIDIEYEWFRKNTNRKIPIKGKYVNETMEIGDLSNVDITDDKYKNSILTQIK